MIRPRVCVLVTGRDDADLDTTLHAVRAVPRADLLVLAVAAPDSSAGAVARRHAAADWRVRALQTREWREGARIAARLRSRYVVALSGGDLLDAAWLAGALAALGPSSPGLGVGSGLRLADPAAAVFGRACWKTVLGAASAGAALAEALARTPDAVRLPGAAAARTPGSTVRGMPDSRPELAGWLDLQDEATDLLGARTPLYSAWAASSLAGEAQRFLEDAERFDEQQWSGLHARVRALAAAGSDDGLDRLPVEARVRVALAAAGRRADLVRFVADRRFAAGQFPTSAAEGVVHAVLPVPADLAADLRRLSPAETALHTELRRLRWVGEDLELEVFACVAGVDLVDHRPEVGARLVEGDRVVPLDVRLDADREVTRWRDSHHVNHDLGVLRLRVPVSSLASPGRLQLEVSVAVAGILRTGRVAAHDPGGSAALLRPRVHRDLEVRAELEPGFALVTSPSSPVEADDWSGAVIEDVRVDDGRLVVRGSGLDAVLLRGPQGRLDPDDVSDGTVAWSLRHDPWGFGPQPVPTGRYVIAARDGGVALSATLGNRLPEVSMADAYRVAVRREPRGSGHALVVALGPPLADDEVGPYCQRRLQEWYAGPGHDLDPTAVYLQAYTGQNATDSPLAIAEELAAARPDLMPTWAVADGASRVPPGSATVLWRSREWYAALARSRYVVTNIELESWFRRRLGQDVLQTFHGYPSKAMGLGLWRQKNFTPTRIEQQLDRTSRNWSLLLTPTPEMDVHYRENYRYDGPILAAGYPRDDLLVAPGADARRAEARARLGIGEDTVAVLYAPTWRDDQATDFRSARLVDHLDVAAAAEALGPGHVLLLRGHRFMAATAAGGSRVLDVTSYPEVNDLILAADAAVLDYSSMRFDFALTGRPMVFLVPDLEDYATVKRGFLYDFAPTAPGPLARSSAEVIEALRDLDGVRERHCDEYARFNETYNRLQDGQSARRTVERFFR
jgi:CDP-glycerol glycerophosphotransferase (TagB/SpsB family)